MSNTQEIIKLIVNEEFHKAKEEITAALNGKIGVLLEEKLIECGASLFEGKKSYSKEECSCGKKNCDCGEKTKK